MANIGQVFLSQWVGIVEFHSRFPLSYGLIFAIQSGQGDPCQMEKHGAEPILSFGLGCFSLFPDFHNGSIIPEVRQAFNFFSPGIPTLGLANFKTITIGTGGGVISIYHQEMNQIRQRMNIVLGFLQRCLGSGNGLVYFTLLPADQTEIVAGRHKFGISLQDLIFGLASSGIVARF